MIAPLSQSNGAISQFYSSQEVLQSQPFFILVVGIASMQFLFFFSAYIWPWEEHILHPCQKGLPNTHIWQWEEHILHPCQKGLALTSDHRRNQSYIYVRKALHLHFTMRGTHPSFMLEGIYTYIWPWEEHIPHSCQKGSRTHHFPLKGTSIWRTKNFSLKYSYFTLAISTIESHQG